MILKVGQKYLMNGEWVRFGYRDIEWHKGWADAFRFLPDDGDFCDIQVEGKGRMPGWIYGTTWDALRFKRGDRVMKWKRRPEEKVTFMD